MPKPFQLPPPAAPTEMSCPPLIGIHSDPAWRNTQVTLPESRGPGAIVRFNCTKEIWTAGVGDQGTANVNSTSAGIEEPRRTSSGAVECIANATGMMPEWNDTLELPCVRKSYVCFIVYLSVYPVNFLYSCIHLFF